MNIKIEEALAKLDPTNDNHWTADGLPRIDTVKMLAGDQGLTRDSITAVSPTFNREQALAGGVIAVVAPTTQAQAEGAVAATVATAVQAIPVATPTPKAAKPAEVIVVGVAPQLNAEEYATEIEFREAGVAVATKLRNDAQAVLDEAQARLDDAINAHFASGAAESNADAISGYLSSQRKLLEHRAEQAATLREAGITAKSLAAMLPSKAPIDRALAGKRK